MTDPERMVSQALRAQAGSARQAPMGRGRSTLPPPRPFPIGWVLLIMLLVGAVIGMALALVSIFQPGVLPALG